MGSMGDVFRVENPDKKEIKALLKQAARQNKSDKRAQMESLAIAKGAQLNSKQTISK